MRARTTIITAVALAIAASSPAIAARRPPVKLCNLLTDTKGDGTWGNGHGAVNSAALDIISADIATGRNELVAVMRMQSLDTTNDTWRPLLGYEWAFGVTGGGTRYEFKMSRGLGTAPVDKWSVKIGDTTPKFTYQIVGNALVWRIQRKDAPALNRPKLVWSVFGANSKALSGTADDAFSQKATYPDRAASCVTAK